MQTKNEEILDGHHVSNKWEPATALDTYQYENLDANELSNIRHKWSDIKQKYGQDETEQAAFDIWSIHAGDIESVYRLNKNVIESYLVHKQFPKMSDGDLELLKHGDESDLNAVASILEQQAKAMETAAKEKDTKLTEDKVKEYHNLIVKAMPFTFQKHLEKYIYVNPGRYKCNPNSILTAKGLFEYCPPKLVPEVCF